MVLQYFGEMEKSGKEALKFSMNCGIAVSVGKINHFVM